MGIDSVGVVGAGTMGAGIAQAAALGGIDVLLHDPIPEALAKGEERLRGALAKGAERGRWSEADAEAAAARARFAASLDELAGCGLVIEAAPEELELKRELFGRLARICGPDAVLATNTSSLSVTAIAAGVPTPGARRRDALLQPAGADEAGRGRRRRATAEAAARGRDRARRADGPHAGPRRRRDRVHRQPRARGRSGSRRCGCSATRVADHATSTASCRLGGGFRMGPFELMDLVGIDVGFEVSKSFWEQSFHEPRWQPHPIQEKMVAAGRHGRKAGRGYYDYSSGPHRPEDPEPPQAEEDPAALADGVAIEAEGFRAVPLGAGSLAATAPRADAVGYYALPPIAAAPLVELTRGPATSDCSTAAAERFFAARGKHVEWVGDAPGLALGRIVCQIVNEASFALQKGIGSAPDVDTAMRLGFNYPRGPIEWGEAIGLDHALGLLDALHSEVGEERYRASPLLRAAVADQAPLSRSPTAAAR